MRKRNCLLYKKLVTGSGIEYQVLSGLCRRGSPQAYIYSMSQMNLKFSAKVTEWGIFGEIAGCNHFDWTCLLVLFPPHLSTSVAQYPMILSSRSGNYSKVRPWIASMPLPIIVEWLGWYMCG
jgi:hypothetical protein